MRALYVYPHPDDESFGPGPVLAGQRRQGHEVFLLTLTRGGATRQRHRLGYSVEKMGEVRFAEMQAVARVLDLSGLSVLDFPDSGLAEMDPRVLEAAVRAEVLRVRPHVLVTYPVHGISGFRDHLVCHAVVKRVFWEMRAVPGGPQRLAFHTVTEEGAALSPHFRLSASKPEEVDCVIRPESADAARGARALDCYSTYQETVEASGVRAILGQPLSLEFHDERFDPPLADLFAELPSGPHEP